MRVFCGVTVTICLGKASLPWFLYSAPLWCLPQVSPFPVVLVTKLSLRSRIQEGSYPTPPISLLERTPISTLTMVMSTPKLSASSLCFPRTPKLQRGKYLHGRFSADLEGDVLLCCPGARSNCLHSSPGLCKPQCVLIFSQKGTRGHFVRISCPKLAE